MSTSFAPQLSLAPDIRGLVHDHIAQVVAAFDAHDPGILDGVYQCRGACGWRGTEAEWHAHLAEKISDALTAQTAELST